MENALRPELIRVLGTAWFHLYFRIDRRSVYIHVAAHTAGRQIEITVPRRGMDYELIALKIGMLI